MVVKTSTIGILCPDCMNISCKGFVEKRVVQPVYNIYVLVKDLYNIKNVYRLGKKNLTNVHVIPVHNSKSVKLQDFFRMNRNLIMCNFLIK